MKNLTPLIIGLLLICEPLKAASRTEAAMTFMEIPGARAGALSQAVAPLRNEIAAFGYNPASLGSLRQGHALFHLNRTGEDESFGQFLGGVPTRHGGVGVSVGYYNAGEIEAFDGTTARTVTAQRDILIGLGLARTIAGVDYGITVKHLSSELAEKEKASAQAVDLGAAIDFSRRLRLSAGLQNLGTALQYADEGDELPRMARLGAAYDKRIYNVPVTMLIDAPYSFTRHVIEPALALEARLGVLAMRMGYKQGDSREISCGLGFGFGSTSFAYSMALLSQTETNQKISVDFRFGQTRQPTPRQQKWDLELNDEDDQFRRHKLGDLYTQEKR